jgi:hypothetical protein
MAEGGQGSSGGQESSVGDISFAVGRHRPVYFWGGPTTVRMNRLKFMDAPINEDVHLSAHTPDAAHRLVQAGFNWAYLMHNWGFPPEVDAEQWADFRQAVQTFHEAGLRVFGYVQLSNCVYAGSHVEKDWYARDQRGRFIHYYTGRYMTCWLHPEWRAQLRQRVHEIVEAGSDGVFFDNPWLGLHTLSLFDTWVSGAGCYCPRCQEAYAQASGGRSIPGQLDPEDPHSQHYLSWRVEVVWQLIGELIETARSLRRDNCSRPDVVVAENVYDAINCNHYAEFGVDLRQAARVSDMLMIEDHSLPHVASDGTPVVNAITCKAARAWADGIPVTTDPYMAGIGFDSVYTPRQFRRAVAEGAACGTATVVKGTEFCDPRDGGFTLLTGEPFSAEREALGHIHRWLEAHAGLYENRREVSPLAVYFPYATLPFDWRYAAPLTFAACQTLLMAGLPYRIVGPGDWDAASPEGQTLIVPPGGDEGLAQRLREFASAGGRVIALGERAPGERAQSERAPVGRGPEGQLVWARERPGPTFLQRHPALRGAVGRAAMTLYRAYFDRRAFRALLDRTHVTQRVLQGGSDYNPLFRVPPLEERVMLLEALGNPPMPKVRAAKPVLIEWWRQDEADKRRPADSGRPADKRRPIDQLHLVNYADEPRDVAVILPWAVRARALSPDTEEVSTLEGRLLRFRLDVYTVLLCERLEGER